jgi:1-acyl-sn-glycerol-3-phosphate acyltransferase
VTRAFRDRVLDWAATGVTVPGVFAALVVYDLVQRVAIRVGGPRAHQRAVSAMARASNRAVRLSGARFRVEGREHLEPGAHYIIVANHQSVFDIAMASDFLEPLAPRYVSKRELARGVPGVSYNLTHGGSALIDRKDPAQARAAIETLARHVRDDAWSVVIYPEGTRSRTGAMRPFREAGLRTLVANAPGVKVLPLTTWGGTKLFRHGLRPVVRGVELGFKLHAPVAPPDPDDADAFAAFVSAIEATIRDALPPEDAAGRAGA